MSRLRPVRRMGCLGVALIFVQGCDLLEPVTANPNTVPTASLDQLLVTTTVETWGSAYGSYVSSIWLQHVDGIDRQTGFRSRYQFDENSVNLYSGAYTRGGLIDIRKGIELAEADGRRSYAGIFKVLEGLLMGGVASAYGNIAYSEAVNEEFPRPVLDPQREVYEAIQALLDEAISDLQSGEGLPPGGADVTYGGDLDSWVAAANTLKARYHLHWVEVDGPDRYASALAAANQGITSWSRDFMIDHSTLPTERNGWSRISPDVVVAGEYLVDALKARSDPRLRLYFGEGTGAFTGQIVGSPPGGDQPGDPGADSSEFACVRGAVSPAACPLGRGYGSDDWDFPILSCAETYLIIAEAEYHLGSEAATRTALDAALECEEARKGVSLSELRASVPELSGETLLEEIMTQKYVSLFLHPEVWNDYKRTCLPALPTYHGLELPGRYLYPGFARTANPNIPDPDQQPDRNANDPNPCPPVGG